MRKSIIKRIAEKVLKTLIYIDNKKILTLPDKTYLKIQYKVRCHQNLNLENPKTFNEKLQWLKLNNRNTEYTKMVDKYQVKEFIANKIGNEYVIPTIGVWNSFNEINFSDLPDQFVLKTTHDSGSIVVCKDKKHFDTKSAKEKLEKSLRRDYYRLAREWPYKGVSPKIIAEQYMEDNSGGLTDYKVYSFNGKCEYVMTCTDRDKGDTKFIYYDRFWNKQLQFSNDGKKYGDSINIEKPENLEKMFEFAEILSKGIPFVRVDFYEVQGNLYFGEMTFYPSAGFDTTRTKECEEMLAKSLNLEEVK